MNNVNRSQTRPYHFRRFGDTGYQFDATATEVAILDRSGRAIWKQSKGEAPTPIQWMGMNEAGQFVETGDYICKIVYPNAEVAYLPFVFMKRG